MKVLFYVHDKAGNWNLTDNYIKNIFVKMQEQHLVRKVFTRGAIETPDDFLDFMQSPQNHLQIICEDNGNPLLICWVNGIEDKHASIHWCLFKETWGKNSIELGFMARDNWLNLKDKNGNYHLNMLIGITPIDNKLAIRFLKNIGAKCVGVIPNHMYNIYTKKYEGLMISYYQREGATWGTAAIS